MFEQLLNAIVFGKSIKAHWAYFETISYFGNSLQAYFLAFGVLILSLIILYVIKYFILARLKALAKKTKTDYDDILIDSIQAISWPFYVALSIYFALRYLVLSEALDRYANYGILIIGSFYALKALNQGIDSFGLSIKQKRAQAEGHEYAEESQIIDIMTLIGKLVLFGVIFIMVISNLGFNVTSLVAGLGIGGIAVAFALQNVLSDIFASFSIYFDKPFRVGDMIQIDKDSGTVKRIGIKTTRLQTAQGQELIVSNKELTNARVANFRRMKSRRVSFIIGIRYETSTLKLKKIPQIMKQIIEKNKQATFESTRFKEFGISSLNFEIAYHIASNDGAVYLDMQDAINYDIKESFEKNQIDIAYPTQTIILDAKKKA